MQVLSLHLPQGMEAKSLLASDQGIFLRAWDGPQTKQLLLVQLDPLSGIATRLLNSPQLTPDDIVCAHAGKYIGLHWISEDPDDQKAYLMVGAE